MKKTIAEMDDETFKKNVEGVLVGKREKDFTIAKETSRFWGEIANHDYNFNRKSEEIAMLENEINLKDV